MQPRLKTYAYFAPVAEGVLFRTWHGSFVLNGKSAYGLVEKLVPLLDGTRTVDEICAGLSPTVDQYIRKMITRLVEQGVVKDCSAQQPFTATPQEQRLFAASMAFLDDYLPEPAPAWERFRHTGILLVGAGVSLRSAARSLFASGLRRLHVMATDQGATRSMIEADCQRFRQEPVPIALHLVPPIDWRDPQAAARALSDCQLVCYVHDNPDRDQLRALHTAGVTAERPVLSAVVAGATGIVGPWTTPGAATCWECLQQRLLPSGLAPGESVPLIAAMVGNTAALDLFKAITGAMAPETADAVVTVELVNEDMQVTRRPLLPAPRCPHHGAPAVTDTLWARVQHATAPVAESDFLKAIAPILEPMTGRIPYLGQADRRQIPLALAEAHFRIGDHLETVIVAADSHEAARLLAIRAALERCVADGADPQGGRCLLTGAAAPLSDDAAVASGFSYSEWVGRGILAALLQRAEREGVPWTPLDSRSLPTIADRVLLRTLNLRYQLPTQLLLLRLPLAGGVAAAVTSAGKLLGMRAGRTPDEALHAALIAAVGQVQVRVAAAAGAALAELATAPPAMAADGVRLADEDARTPPDWAEWVGAALGTLRLHEARVVGQPWPAEPAVLAAGLVVGRIAVTGGRV